MPNPRAKSALDVPITQGHAGGTLCITFVLTAAYRHTACEVILF